MKKVILYNLILLIFPVLLGGFQKYDTPLKINLAGEWQFSLDPEKAGITEKWYQKDLASGINGITQIKLPGTTDISKVGLPNPVKPNLDGLYRSNIYTGTAWYQREINIPSDWNNKHITLFMERTHWVTQVWLDDKYMGSQDNLISPHIYDFGTDVKPGKHRLTICVDNTLKYNLGRFVSINYEGTQTNWNGIIGAIELHAETLVAISNIEVYPDVDHKSIKVEAEISNLTGSTTKGKITFSVTDPSGIQATKPITTSFVSDKQLSLVRLEILMGDNPKLWDEFTPNLYSIKASLATSKSKNVSEKEVSFGMRKLSTDGTMFTMNNRTICLRGTLECAIFPLTGYPSTDVDEWSRIYKTMKSYGLNFIRFHSWTPPEAAFIAADKEGIMIQTEGPQANVQAGKVNEQDAFMEKELLGIVKTYGNHPSFCFMSLGNEYGGNAKILTHWVDTLIKTDSRHLYSSASNAQTTPNRQFTTHGRGRGIHGPGTMSDVSFVLKNEDKSIPLVGHEIGQWTFYPNFNEIPKYTGVLQAKNFEIVRDSLKSAGMLDQAQAFFKATGEQAILLYKEEIENLLRTPCYSGFALLDLHDYPGQGTALIGLLDPFWDSKGFISPDEFKRFCGTTVPLIRIPKRTYFSNEPFSAKVQISHFGPDDLPDSPIEWSIQDDKGLVVSSGSFPKSVLKTGKLTDIGDINASLSDAKAPGKFTVKVSIKNSAFSNSWNIWIYKPVAETTLPTNVIISHKWDDATQSALAQGKKVLLLPDTIESKMVMKGSFSPVFWSPIWFRRIPNTMGILCNPEHPVFSQFPTDFYSNWQWWNLIQGSTTMILNDTPDEFRPIIQVIDNFARNYKLGNLIEAKVGKGSLLVCTLNLRNKNLPEVSSFINNLYRYAESDSFKPEKELDLNIINRLLLKDTSQK